MRIHKLGFIRNGLCHKRLIARKVRSVGTHKAWEDIKNNRKFVSLKLHKYMIIALPPSKKAGTYGNGNIEIGYLRMIQICFSQLLEQKLRFTNKQMLSWVEAIASLEIGVSMDSPLAIITPGGKCSWGMLPPKPQDDNLYEQLYGIPKGLCKNAG